MTEGAGAAGGRGAAPAGSRVAFLVGGLSGGGHSAVQTALAAAFARDGRAVDLLFFRSPGPAPPEIPPGVRLVDLRQGGGWRGGQRGGRRARRSGRLAVGGLTVLAVQALSARRPFVRPDRGASRLWLWRAWLALTRYLRERQPQALYAVGDRGNLLAVTARAGCRVGTRVVAGLQVAAEPRRLPERTGRRRARLAARLVHRAVRRADRIVACSRGVAADWARAARIPADRITTIHNPVVDPGLPARAAAPLDHRFFGGEGALPVVLGAGRLVEQKDFPTLLRAFALVREREPARLVILGEGEERERLERLAASLGLSGEVDFPGFVENPYAYLARAAVLALSSRWEGLPTILIAGLACGCPVVSTDCPFGPSEILEDGAWGRLVPVGDPVALADALVATLREPPSREGLRQRGRSFSVERAAREYARLVPPGGAGRGFPGGVAGRSGAVRGRDRVSG